MLFLDHIYLIPLLPALGAAIMFFFGRKLTKQTVNAVCVGVVVLAFLIGLRRGDPVQRMGRRQRSQAVREHRLHLARYRHRTSDYATHDGTPANFQIDAGFLLDPLSGIWLLFVTGVGMLIHIYSTGYMAHEGGYYRFFGYLNLFMFSMLTLILANNYVLMFVGWEGVGLCSYLLIGFYFHRKSASDAANKAFIVNRIGDAGFIMGMFFIAWYMGSLRYIDVNAAARSGHFQIGDPIITAATLLLFVGACGKSAQLPLYVWLPDAMEGPTPVSALIHAATMVTAGVYMVARSNALFVLAPTSMKTVAIVGALTAIFAASIGLVQNDIKRVLAYSTVSQLGYMFLALGVGSICCGRVPCLYACVLQGSAVPGRWIGDPRHVGRAGHAQHGRPAADAFPSRTGRCSLPRWRLRAFLRLPDSSRRTKFCGRPGPVKAGPTASCGALGIITALMTAFYMFRLIYLTFYSKPRMSHEVEHHIHESPMSMTVPLVVLAVMSLFAGFLGWPHSLGGSDRFARYLDPVFARAKLTCWWSKARRPTGGGRKGRGTHQSDRIPADGACPWCAAIAGWVMAGRAYGKADKGYAEPIDAAAPPVYNTLLNKYYVDEGYDYVFTGRRKLGEVRLGVMGLGEASSWFDAQHCRRRSECRWMDYAVHRLRSRVGGTSGSSTGSGVNGPAILARCCQLSRATVRVGPGAVVCAGHDRGAGWICFLLLYH